MREVCGRYKEERFCGINFCVICAGFVFNDGQKYI